MSTHHIRPSMREDHEGILSKIGEKFFRYPSGADELDVSMSYNEGKLEGQTFRCEVDSDLQIDRYCYFPWSIRVFFTGATKSKNFDVDVMEVEKWLLKEYPVAHNQLERICLLSDKNGRPMLCLDSVGFRRMSREVCHKDKTWSIHDESGERVYGVKSDNIFFDHFEVDNVIEDYYYENSVTLRPDKDIDQHAKELNYLREP